MFPVRNTAVAWQNFAGNMFMLFGLPMFMYYTIVTNMTV